MIELSHMENICSIVKDDHMLCLQSGCRQAGRTGLYEDWLQGVKVFSLDSAAGLLTSLMVHAGQACTCEGVTRTARILQHPAWRVKDAGHSKLGVEERGNSMDVDGCSRTHSRQARMYGSPGCPSLFFIAVGRAKSH